MTDRSATTPAFATPVTIAGPPRLPRQLLAEQSVDGQASVHDDAAAASLGLSGAPIEGPTHFSLFDPLAHTLWGDQWFERGCISAHFQTMVVEGQTTQASLTRTGPWTATIEAHKEDGTPVLTGTASIGTDDPTELDKRRAAQAAPGRLYIVDQLAVGMTTAEPHLVSIELDESNGPLYPFSLAQKLQVITEPSALYEAEALGSPWGRAVLPFEMASVLAHKHPTDFPVRRPSVGLFLDLEVRMVDGPIFAGETYSLRHTVVGLSESRRTESFWTETRIMDASGERLVAIVTLHSGIFKDSYPGYPSAAAE